VGINCENCHVVDENGIANAEIAWLNVVTNEYEEAKTSTDLCEKCHVTSSGVGVTAGTGVTHQIVLGGSAHRNWAGAWPQEYRPQYCADCHDPHSGAAQLCVDCHDDVPTLETHIKGNNEFMLDKVTCEACHDADGMDVGPHPDEEMEGVFVTLVTSISRATGEPVSEYVYSHSIQWQVSCDRCHFEENPWGLNVRTAAGDLPESEG
jgi:hypothetical protein